MGDGRRELRGNGRDAVAVAVQQVARMDRNAADMNRDVNVEDMAVTVGADRAAREAREGEVFHLVQVTARAAGDEADRAEGLVRRTHHLTKGR